MQNGRFSFVPNLTLLFDRKKIKYNRFYKTHGNTTLEFNNAKIVSIRRSKNEPDKTSPVATFKPNGSIKRNGIIKNTQTDDTGVIKKQSNLKSDKHVFSEKKVGFLDSVHIQNEVCI